MPDVYGNIEVSDEEMASLTVENEPKPTLTDSVTESSEPKSEEVNDAIEEKSETKEETPVKDSEELKYEFQIGEETFDMDSVLDWKKDSENKDNWSKSNTKKAQAIAKGGKLLELLDNDDSFRNHIKEYFYDDKKEIGKYGLDDKFNIPIEEAIKQESEPQQPEVSKEDPRLNQLFDKVEKLEDEKLGRSIGDRYDSLKENNPNFFRDEQDGVEFLQFCNDKGIIKDGDIDMDDTFKLWSYDKVMSKDLKQTQLHNNVLKNGQTKISNSELGAKVERSGAPPKDYRDINMDDPEIQDYFSS